MKNRTKLREIIMKILYQYYILENIEKEVDVNKLIEEAVDIDNNFVKESVYEIIDKQNDINKLANTYLVNWEIDRLNKVDKAIISIGIYELVYTNTPSIVAINETIELSKKYSDEAVTKMINGVLDNIYHSEDCHE